MKKILILLILSLPVFCLAQTNVQGYWKLSTVKLLRLQPDQTFHLTKGAYHYYGNYAVITKNDNSYLRLDFETETLDYEILSLSDSEMVLFDEAKQNRISARRVGEPDPIPEKEVEVVKAAADRYQENAIYKNHYTNIYPDNQYYFSMGIGGGLSFASGPSTESSMEEFGSVVEDFSTSPIISYSAGFRIGYQLSDGLYFGSGGTYTHSGFYANRTASTSDLEYQFDASSTQKAKYTYSSIELPLWFNYRATDRWMIELGALVSLPIPSTSKAFFTGENEVLVNGEIDERTSYTANEYTIEYPDLLDDYAYGGYAEIQRRLTKHLIFSLSYKYIEEYMVFDKSLITNNMFHANLSIQLF